MQTRDDDVECWRAFQTTYIRSSMSESLGPDALEGQRLLPREKAEDKMLTWMEIEATVPMIGKSAKARRRPVLRKVSGVALPREVLAIMGSSGAGKTTLMNILAFQSSKEVESNGAVLVNGKAMTKYEMRRMSAYVQQIDLFCGTLTVKEQLMYSALLRMGNKFSYKEKMEKVEEAIKDMNLFECQDSIIGIPNRKKGISVGEKKRLAFASEILTDPAILFCDEPTSGLDAFMAHQVSYCTHPRYAETFAGLERHVTCAPISKVDGLWVPFCCPRDCYCAASIASHLLFDCYSIADREQEKQPNTK
ncbi:hypothetical protein Y032_0601g502 [Ancylostoma ceylanicum]|uniref:ABC transporter domain-containing protein n=1 Tax=Ancylostoma ceylanicum TaxID=53326 RepID=A0A016WM65_9BILA|nr:hypothetical protein Y032_0601g502 [Ancylostoma ceylanicum]